MKDIQGYEGRYAITEDGKVWSYKHQKFLKPETVWNGYYRVSLTDSEGVVKHHRVHRLVAETYIPNDDPEEKTQVNHINERKTDNRVENLEWVSPKENINYGARTEKAVQKTSKPVYCVELDQVFVSQAAAARALGIWSASISSCVRGKTKTAGGYHWEQYNPDLKQFDDALAADLLLLELEESVSQQD